MKLPDKIEKRNKRSKQSRQTSQVRQEGSSKKKGLSTLVGLLIIIALSFLINHIADLADIKDLKDIKDVKSIEDVKDVVIDFLDSAEAASGESQEVVQEDKQETKNIIPAELVRVVDADTLILKVDGRNERCRLIGIDAPESVDDNPERKTKEGVAASEFLKNYLASYEGDYYIEADVEKYDQYDRLLVYVWLEDLMLNEMLCREGYAYQKSYPPNTRYDHALRVAAAEAKAEGRGIWAD